jgi:uncharacterized protein YhjY with autotransporter beta-barrel domain
MRAARRVTPQIISAVGAVTAAILVLVAPGAWAQSGVTLDQAVSGALSNSCAALGGASGGSFGPGIGAPSSILSLCPTAASGAVQGTSGGSVTAGTREGVSDEERRVLQRLKEKRDTETKLRGLSLFVSGEFEAFDKRITKFEPGYSSDRWGGTVGADYAFTDWMVAGIAFSYAHVDGAFKHSRGSFDTDSYGPLVYAGFVPARNFFIDVVAGYTRKDFEIERDVDFAGSTGNGFVERHGSAIGETTGNEYTAGVNVGYDFIFGSLTVGPRVGVNFKHITIDRFDERGRRGQACLNGTCFPVSTTGLELAYDRQEEASLTTVAGIFASFAISTGFGVLIPQATFEYLHEFEDDQRAITFHFVDDLQRHKIRFHNDPPDRDYFHAGAGLVLVLPGGFSPFVNYRSLLGYKDHSSHIVTAGLRFSF